MKTLVVYFSQTGKTKAAAERIAQLSGADLVEIKTYRSYQMSYRKNSIYIIKRNSAERTARTGYGDSGYFSI